MSDSTVPRVDIVKCRTFGHSWDEFDPRYHETARDWGADVWRITLRCTRCTTERYDYLNSIGGVVSRNYAYPVGYKEAGVTRAEYRLEYRTYIVKGKNRPLRAVKS